MKNVLGISGLIFTILLTFSCEKKEIPILTTAEVINIAGTTATSGGTVTDEGSGRVISRGVCWSTGTTPTINDNKTSDGAGAGAFTSNMSGLNAVTAYYVRAYATNSAGTGYGMEMFFTTLGQTPIVTISNIDNITSTGATLYGLLNANFVSTEVTFEYGTSTAYGQSVPAIQSPVTAYERMYINVSLAGLNLKTTYHIRIKAANSLGTTYSRDTTFTTLGLVPIVSTLAATNVTSFGATLHGTVNANTLSTDVTFENGTTASYSITIPAIQNPVTGNSITDLSANITGLAEGTIYHFRIKAVNYDGIVYANDQVFTTIIPTQFNPNITYGTLTYIYSNVYKTVDIGTQTWMAENLKSTKANEILNLLRNKVKTSLHQTGKEGEAADGMDIALCMLHKNKKTLEYAGAYNPLFFFHDGTLKEYKVDRMPIGSHYGEKETFSNIEIKIARDDAIYLFSDEFCDQFGGPDGVKYKTANLKKLLTAINHEPMSIQKTLIEKEIERWKGTFNQVDDISIIGFRI